MTGYSSQTRDFVHVDDIVQANLLAATTGTVGDDTVPVSLGGNSPGISETKAE